MTMLLTIGDLLFDSDSDSEIRFVVSGLKSKRKLTGAAGQGDDDGTLTRGGREPRELKVTWDWPNLAEVNAAMQPTIAALDASVPTTKATKPLPFGYEVDGLDIAALKAIRIIEVESTDGPDLDVEKGTWKYEASFKSASPPKQKAGATSKATDADGVNQTWKDAPPKNGRAASTSYDAVPKVKP